MPDPKSSKSPKLSKYAKNLSKSPKSPKYANNLNNLSASPTLCTVSNCAQCPSSLSVCKRCLPAYRLNNNKCEACPPGCRVCVSPSLCTACLKGYSIDSQGQGVGCEREGGGVDSLSPLTQWILGIIMIIIIVGLLIAFYIRKNKGRKHRGDKYTGMENWNNTGEANDLEGPGF